MMLVLRVVIDTNILVGSLLSPTGANRAVLRACLQGKLQPLVGETLMHEYEDVLGREDLFTNCVLTAGERQQLIDALLSVSEWVKVFYSWRPNLADEGDNHLTEIAVAGGADCIVTNNVRDFAHPELLFPGIRVLRPNEALKEIQ